jgi:hypothetical protein
MIDLSGVRKIWSLLDRTERRNALIVLALLIVAALAAAFMVGSVVPFLTILSNPARIEQVGPLNWAYETFGFQSNYSFLVAVGVVTLGVILLSNLLQLLRVYAITRFSQKRIHSLSRKLMSLYLHQPYEFFLDRHSGDMSTRILSETNQVIDTYLTPLANLVASLLTITALLGLLMWVNPVVALGVFAGFGAVYASVYFLVRMRLGRLGPIRMVANQERFKSAREVFGGIKEVKLHGRELTYLSRFSASSHRMVRASITAKLIGDLPSQVIQTVTMGAIILICLVLLDPVALDEGNGMTELVPLLGVIAFAAQRMKPEFGRIYGSMTRMKFGINVVGYDPRGVPEGPLGSSVGPRGGAGAAGPRAHAGIRRRDLPVPQRSREQPQRCHPDDRRGPAHRDRRQHRCGQDHARGHGARAAASHQRAGARRRGRDHTRDPARLAGRRRLCAAGHLPSRRQHLREHRLRGAARPDRRGPRARDRPHRATRRLRVQ